MKITLFVLGWFTLSTYEGLNRIAPLNYNEKVKNQNEYGKKVNR